MRWFKGNLHCHSYWSDGRAFPDQAIRDYRDAGFDFCALTDHNRLEQGRDEWRKVEAEETGWPPTVSRKNFDFYRAGFPDAEWRERDGATEVRLQTPAELIERYDEPGRFLVMPGCEITRCDADYQRHMHLCYINLAGTLPAGEKPGLVQGMPRGWDSTRQIAEAHREVEALAASLGNPPHLSFVCHPHWRYYDLVAQDFIDNSAIRFFEICNNGADFPPVGLLPDDGLYNDRLWDAVNAHRATVGQPLLHAVANDDCHFYPATRTEHPRPFGEAFTMVRAEALTPDVLFDAMERGDCYASCGAILDDMAFDGRTLRVSVPAKKGVSFTVRFITTKRNADLCVVHTVSVPSIGQPDKGGRPARTIPVYSPEIGATVKLAEGARGEAVEAEYTLADDDLYVRARIESDEIAPFYAAGNTAPMHPKVAMAWTQPYAAGDSR